MASSDSAAPSKNGNASGHAQSILVRPTFNHFPPVPGAAYKNDPTTREVIDTELPKVTPSVFDPSLSDYVLPLAWATLLATQANTEEAPFGVAYYGRRTDYGTQAIIPWKLRIDPDERVGDALAAAAKYDENMRPLERLGLQKLSSQSSDNSLLCNFRTLLVINLQGDNESLADGDENFSDKYPLVLYARRSEKDNSIHLRTTFDSQILSRDSSGLLLTTLTDIIEHITSQASSDSLVLRDLQTIGTKGLSLVRQWNASCSTDNSIDIAAWKLIEYHFTLQPSAPAVSAWDGSLTYHELDLWSRHLANRLLDPKQGGVQPGQFVAFQMPKSQIVPVALVGAIRAGVGFIFLPLSISRQRLQAMCRISDVQCVLTPAGQGNSALDMGVRVLEMETQCPLLNDTTITTTTTENSKGSQAHSIPDSYPLYAVFTSGSTGEPKGVMVDRGSYGPGLHNLFAHSSLNSSSRVLHFSGYSFVISVAEQLMTLSAGACLCIPSEIQLREDLEAAISQYNATWSILTPSVGRLLSPSRTKSLKSLLFAGEVVTPADAARWEDSTTRVFCFFGQSETASSYMLCQMNHQGQKYESGILGLPTVAKTWIVDPQNYNRLVPVGHEGELLFESPGLAREYLKNPQISKATFVETPVWSTSYAGQSSNNRWLLTGDIVRYHQLDGSIQLVGRKGTRTKIRGQRVELGEVESHLRKQFPTAEQIIAEVVTPHADEKDDSQVSQILVAFVYGLGDEVQPSATTAAASAAGENENLVAESSPAFRAQCRHALAALRDILPDFMVPSVILPLNFLPRTVSGKLYRKGMRDWAAQQTAKDILTSDKDGRAPFRPPQTKEESALQAVCAEVLGIPISSVGMEDNFFHLGGDSLTARKLANTAALHDLSFSVADVFNQPTLAKLAVCTSRASNNSQKAVSITNTNWDPFAALKARLLDNPPKGVTDPANVEDAYPATELQALAIETHMIDYFPFSIQGTVDSDRFRRACQSFINSQPALRSLWTTFEGRIVQVVLSKVDVTWSELRAPGDMNAEDLMAWTRSVVVKDQDEKPPLDEPVAAFTLVRSQDPQNSTFFMRLSHSQYDGVCISAISHQLSAFYNDNGSGTALPRTSGTTSTTYRKLCERLRTPEAYQYWREILADGEPTCLPRISDGGDISIFHSGDCAPVDPPPGITMGTAIKAAWAYVLSVVTNRTDVLFSQVINTRSNHPQEADQDLIGMCLNLIPVRVRFASLSSSSNTGQLCTARELFEAIQDQHVRGFEYETMDWGDMVRNCTDWPEDRTLDSLVLHENFSGDTDLDLGQWARGKIADPIFAAPGLQYHMLATWPGPHKLTTFLINKAGALDKEYAEGLVDLFNKTLVRFLDFPDEPLGQLRN